MRPKPVILRARAKRDVEEAIAFHPAEGAREGALGFIEALEAAYAHIGRHPATGSPRYADEFALPGVRSWPLAGYPHRVFYVERLDHVDVGRVLHSQRDIPARLSN